MQATMKIYNLPLRDNAFAFSAESQEDTDTESIQLAYKSWRRQPKPTMRDLFEIFPEAIEAVEIKLCEEQEVLTAYVLDLKERVTEDGKYEAFTQWFLRELRKNLLGPALEHSWNRIQRYRRYLSIARGEDQQKTGIHSEDIAAAKAVPLESLMRVKRSGRTRAYANCPFHDDRTPSFVIYKEGNTFHCFGCSEHGDAIDFVMRSEGLSFREAIRTLIGR